MGWQGPEGSQVMAYPPSNQREMEACIGFGSSLRSCSLRDRGVGAWEQLGISHKSSRSCKEGGGKWMRGQGDRDQQGQQSRLVSCPWGKVG